ncbi:hypothetical protein [Ciceribacter sp. L1K22]|uniref:hypothetical protein n=1 Tax=Ciceribacter sp. L1K22 TaxID=2820275 RepID=UPI001ABDFEA7|nr:hypothetical protein [Ciceribacter sp. L1K22]MBO3759084.1 hypothetical protein [Ciceribacter sp. L1K22]
MTKRADRVLAVIALLAIFMLLAAFFSSDRFFEWAFERHQNTASWAVRPLLLLPLCYSAWHRSMAGVMLSVLAILSSMFWFPTPDEVRPDVEKFLAMERAVLRNGWTSSSMAGLAAILLYATALIAAFWRRSWRLGLAVALLGAAGKIGWSVAASPGAGSAVVPFALVGVTALVAGLLLWRRLLN